MQKLELGKYRCRVCEAVVETGPHDDPPLSILISSSGRADQRVVMINGHEIHRCRLPPEQS